MSTGRFSSGMRHAGMMILLALLVLNVIAYTPDLIGVEELGKCSRHPIPRRRLAMRPSKAQDERAQIHIFEMITLFWLFFMSALFVLRIHVPDPPTAAYDGTLAGAGEDAIRLALADEGGNDSTFIEALRIGDLDAACTDLQDGIPVVTVGQIVG